MSLAETYQELYEFELSRRSELGAALTLPTGVVSLVVGALVLMAKELHLPMGRMEEVQLMSMAVSALACVGAGAFLFHSLFNFAYGYLPTAGNLKEYRDGLVVFHVASGKAQPDAEAAADSETIDYINEQYVVNADRNTANNEIKSAALHNAHFCIIIASLFTTAAGGCLRRPGDQTRRRAE